MHLLPLFPPSLFHILRLFSSCLLTSEFIFPVSHRYLTTMSSSLDLPNDPLLGDALFNRIQVFGDLAKAVARNPALVKLLESSFTTEERDHFASLLRDLLPDSCRELVKNPWATFIGYCKWVLLNFVWCEIAKAYW
jgi:hypothetical protein